MRAVCCTPITSERQRLQYRKIQEGIGFIVSLPADGNTGDGLEQVRRAAIGGKEAHNQRKCRIMHAEMLSVWMENKSQLPTNMITCYGMWSLSDMDQMDQSS